MLNVRKRTKFHKKAFSSEMDDCGAISRALAKNECAAPPPVAFLLSSAPCRAPRYEGRVRDGNAHAGSVTVRHHLGIELMGERGDEAGAKASARGRVGAFLASHAIVG